MEHSLEVPLSNGQIMYVEVTSQDDWDTIGPVSRRSDGVAALPERLSEGLDRIRSFSDEVLTRLRSGSRPPDLVQVQFGVKLSAKTGVIVAESNGEAHLAVTLQWQRSSPDIADEPAGEPAPDAEPEPTG
ncbi:CU044_2847 family protein [Streptomyces sp. WI03-4A]|uniref:CU044_2847 family protein n=1 Tax=Streptomyces TaxID=1883 RepID=UPI0029BF9FA5|nr:CU044_2847 family protein [Streptomyces sp. WI03-4A]MDX2591977.1 CU044_2847 family protein [Streptomyces sp. WI03-4A]